MAKQRVIIKSDTRQLAGRLFTSSEPTGSAVLFVHGFEARGRTCEQYAKRLAQNGVTSLTFDLSGHGDSNGERDMLSVNDHVVDVWSAYDFLVAQNKTPLDLGRIGIAGMSYGGYLAALASSKVPTKSLLLRAPALYPKTLQAKVRGTYTNKEALQGTPEPDNPALNAVRNFAGKISLVASELDTVISPDIISVYRNAAQNNEYSVLKNAQHWLDTQSQQQFQPIVSAWAAEL